MLRKAIQTTSDLMQTQNMKVSLDLIENAEEMIFNSFPDLKSAK